MLEKPPTKFYWSTRPLDERMQELLDYFEYIRQGGLIDNSVDGYFYTAWKTDMFWTFAKDEKMVQDFLLLMLQFKDPNEHNHKCFQEDFYKIYENIREHLYPQGISDYTYELLREINKVYSGLIDDCIEFTIHTQPKGLVGLLDNHKTLTLIEDNLLTKSYDELVEANSTEKYLIDLHYLWLCKLNDYSYLQNNWSIIKNIIDTITSYPYEDGGPYTLKGGDTRIWGYVDDWVDVRVKEQVQSYLIESAVKNNTLLDLLYLDLAVKYPTYNEAPMTFLPIIILPGLDINYCTSLLDRAEGAKYMEVCLGIIPNPIEFIGPDMY